MAKLEFQTITFEEQEDSIRLVFLRMFETSISKADIALLGKFNLTSNSIDFPAISEKEFNNKFLPLLDRSFNELKSILTGHRTIYIHQNSGIPLIGTMYFGIVDRGTNILELKPITGCNIDCTFCSVDEGNASKKAVDFVVEDDYMIQEVARIIDYKKEHAEKKKDDDNDDLKIDIFINTHGEPLLYASMPSLIKGLRAMPEVNTISIITNATLLTTKLADELIEAGLNQLNVSLNAIDENKAKELAGTDAYNVNKVVDICCYIANKIKLIIAPVWIKGKNDEEIPKIVNFAKGIGAEIGIQNYMVHKKGRKTAKQVEWEEFYTQLEIWEKETQTDLKAKEHTLFKTEKLPKPFQKGDTVRAEIVCPGRWGNETLAKADNRIISIINPKKDKGTIKARILKDKDNLFIGEEV